MEALMTSDRITTSAKKMRKLPYRYNRILMPLFLSIFMSCIVAGISTVMGSGISPDLPLKWLKAWGTSWMVAFPSLFVILPIVRRIVAVLVEQTP
jgi:hypothetical protein